VHIAVSGILADFAGANDITIKITKERDPGPVCGSDSKV